MKPITQADVTGKKAIVWTDLDVAVKDGRVVEDARLITAVKTIRYLLDQKAQILLLGHSGRPKGRELRFSLKPISDRLSELIGLEIELLSEIRTPMKEVAMLENIRFWLEEEERNKDFVRKIADLGQIYVNDCFSSSHHAGATMLFMPEFLPSYSGLSLEREVKELSRIMENPKKPLVAIIGGAKLDTKLPAITNLAKIADTVLVGGKIMFEAQKTHLPDHVVVAVDSKEKKDIGEKTIALFREKLKSASTVVWNGPMGLFEEEEFANGTNQIAQAVVESGAYSVVGGGETIEALNKAGLLEKMNFVSMGGGAMLDFLSGKKLPGIAVLD